MASRLKSISQFLVSFVILMGVCTLRALPAYERGTYCTEGGEWLSRMWQTGFWDMIFGARGDYGVLGNMVVIKGADWLTQIWGGHSLADCGPFIQQTLSCLYVALIFVFIWGVLRAHHGATRALLVTVVMSLVPDLDGDNRIFGEANNVGFFNALGIVFLYYDLWLRQQISTRRSIAYGLLIVFHLLTSPLAALIAAGFCFLLSMRALWLWRKVSQPLPKVLWLHSGTLVLAAWSVLQAKPETADPNAEMAAHTAAAAMPQFRSHFVELVLGRQFLYPLIVTVYRSFSNHLTVALFVVVLALLAGWIWTEYRRAGKQTDWARLSIHGLLFGIALCMSAITLWSRGWLVQSDEPYSTLWPARYYLVQTMLAAGAMTLVMLRAADLWPRWRMTFILSLLAMTATFVIPQVAVIRDYLNHHDPSVRAKEWRHQLARVYDLQMMSNGGHLPVNPELLYKVEMYIGNHFVNVPAKMLSDYFATKKAERDDLCSIGMKAATHMKPESSRRPWNLVTKALRVIPRHNGTLVTADLELTEAPHFDVQRRKLWLGSLPGVNKLQATVYAERMPRESEASNRRLSDIERLLFKVQLWFDERLTAMQARERLAGLPVVLGRDAGEYIASGMLMHAMEEPAFSSLVDDDKVSMTLHPLDRAWEWSWSPGEVKVQNVTLSDKGFKMKQNTAFDEPSYVRLNPDVAAALADHSISSGKAHFDHWGKNEVRQTCTYSATLDLTKAALTTEDLAGIRIEINKPSDRPKRVRCVLHGTKSELTSLVLVPTEGGLAFQAYYFPTHFLGNSYDILSLEIQFEQPVKTHNFYIEDIKIYRSTL